MGADQNFQGLRNSSCDIQPGGQDIGFARLDGLDIEAVRKAEQRYLKDLRSSVLYLETEIFLPAGRGNSAEHDAAAVALPQGDADVREILLCIPFDPNPAGEVHAGT